MYKYSKKALWMNVIFLFILLYLIVVVDVDIIYKFVIALVAFLIFRDAVKEKQAAFEVKGDRLCIMNKDEVVREITYKEMRYLTITRKNKKWVIIADDEKILFTIKPRIENYEQMVADLIRLNRSNKKLVVHDYIKKTYSKPQ